jgi:HAE1 family hydrophobic/amphiphilic exporter-1
VPADVQQQDLARRRPELAGSGTHRADVPPGTDRSGGTSSGRRSLKQRGGIIGIVKRRFGRG